VSVLYQKVLCKECVRLCLHDLTHLEVVSDVLDVMLENGRSSSRGSVCSAECFIWRSHRPCEEMLLV